MTGTWPLFDGAYYEDFDRFCCGSGSGGLSLSCTPSVYRLIWQYTCILWRKLDMSTYSLASSTVAVRMEETGGVPSWAASLIFEIWETRPLCSSKASTGGLLTKCYLVFTLYGVVDFFLLPDRPLLRCFEGELYSWFYGCWWWTVAEAIIGFLLFLVFDLDERITALLSMGYQWAS